MRPARFCFLRPALFACFVLVLGVASVWGQAAERRVALVIGNGKYQYSPPLKNPANDATDVAQTLRGYGFTVTVLADADRLAMEKAVRDFGTALKGADTVGLFYYSGHGASAEGQNYLLPIDADIQDQDELRYKAVDAEQLLAKMRSAENKLNIVFLDACRNNPFPGSSRAAEKGLSTVKARVPESVIVFATDPGATALDGDGRNSPFTDSFLACVAEPGLDITLMLKRLTSRVREQTKGAQTPWVSSNLTQDFTFSAAVPPASATGSAPKARLTAAKAYGGVDITGKTTGTLYLDGVEVGTVASGVTSRLDNVETGARVLEMRYADGRSETLRATVTTDGTVSAVFSYVPSVPAASKFQTEAMASSGTSPQVKPSLAILDTFDVPGSSPTALEWDGSRLWIADNLKKVFMVDGRGAVLKSFSFSKDIYDLAWDGSAMWVYSDKLYKIDESGVTLSSLPIFYWYGSGLAWDGSAFWVGDYNLGKIYKHSGSGAVLRYFATDFFGHPTGIAFDGSNLLVGDSFESGNCVYRYSRDGAKLGYVSLDSVGLTKVKTFESKALAWDGQNLWYSSSARFKVYKLAVNAWQ